MTWIMKLTCLAFQKFQEVCYVIEERNDLLNSINNFLDETVVLPPGIILIYFNLKILAI